MDYWIEAIIAKDNIHLGITYKSYKLTKFVKV